MNDLVSTYSLHNSPKTPDFSFSGEKKNAPHRRFDKGPSPNILKTQQYKQETVAWVSLAMSNLFTGLVVTPGAYDFGNLGDVGLATVFFAIQPCGRNSEGLRKGTKESRSPPRQEVRIIPNPRVMP